MTDPVAQDLAALTLGRGPAPEAARHEAARRLLDVYSLSTASGADRAVRIAKSLAEPRNDQSGVSIWGEPGRHDLPGAVLANSVATRYRDMNDSYFNRESLHPSDMVPALWGLAEQTGASVEQLLDAVCVGYDVAVDMADTWRTSARGADHVNLIRFGTVAGAASLLGLDETRTAQAFAIAATNQIATRQTRRGNLTMWKGYAAGDSAVAGLRAVRMAAAGVEGPTLSFVGDMGFQAVAVDPTTWVDRWPTGDGRPRILDTHLKVYPVGYLAQAPAEVATVLHGELAGRRPVDVRISTYRRAKEIMADPEKWHPASAETADHSLPYIVAVCLLDGRVSTDSMDPSRWTASDVASLLPRVEVVVDEAMTAAYPTEMAARIEVATDTGEQLGREVPWPLGHARRPLTDDQLLSRSLELMEPVLGGEASRATARRLLDPDLEAPAARLAA